MTKNEIVYSIADALGKTLEDAFISRLNSRVLDKYAVFIRRDTEKNGISDHFVLPYIAELEEKDLGFCDNIVTNCAVLVTKNPIPSPVRLSDMDDRLFVGSADGLQSYSKIEIEEYFNTRFNRFTSKTIKYAIRKNHIVLFNTNRIKHVLIRQVFENPEQAISFCSDSCFDNNVEFPISRDIADIIINELIKENAPTVQVIDNQEVDLNNNNR
jgi:hypothetical protein